MDIFQALTTVTESIKAWATNKLTNKVDKVEGKILSSNDYTDEDVKKLNSIGDLSALNTIEKNTLVGSINELKKNIPNMLSNLTDDSTHRTVTDAEKETWNAKSDFSGNYDDLTNKPIADDFGVYVQDTEPTEAVDGDIWVDTANDPDIMTVSSPVLSVNNQTGEVVINVPTKVSELTNDKGYITSAPVQSVNGKTGAVEITVSSIGAESVGTAYSIMSEHNSDETAHADIREVISQLSGAVETPLMLTDMVGYDIAPTGVLLDRNGSETQVVSQLISVTGGEKIRLTCSARFGNSLYAVYDASGAMLDNAVAAPTETGTVMDGQEVAMVNGAATMRLAWHKDVTDTPYAAVRITTKDESRSLEGQIVAIVGDSIVEKNATASTKFPQLIAAATGAQIINLGVGGTGYMAGQDTETAYRHRTAQIPDNVDRVLIFGSGNDRNMTLGSVTDTGTDTLCGCINATLDAVFARAPTAWVGVVGPAPWMHYPPYEEGNAMALMAQAQAEICCRRGIPYLDLYHCSGLRPWDETFRELAYSKDNGDGTHPDEVGHAMIAPQIQAFLEGAVQTPSITVGNYVLQAVLPDVTDADNGKVLMVVDGTWQAVDLNLSTDENGTLYI